MAYMLSEKSIVTSVTASRCSTGIFINCSDTSPHHGDYRTLAPVTVFVRQDCEQIVAQRCLVDAESDTHVLWQKHPVCGMADLRPLPEVAQIVLIVPFQS